MVVAAIGTVAGVVDIDVVFAIEVALPVDRSLVIVTVFKTVV